MLPELVIFLCLGKLIFSSLYLQSAAHFLLSDCSSGLFPIDSKLCDSDSAYRTVLGFSSHELCGTVVSVQLVK